MQTIEYPVTITTRYGLQFGQLIEVEPSEGPLSVSLDSFFDRIARINNTANQRHNIQCTDYFVLKDASGIEFYALLDDSKWQLFDRMPKELLYCVLSST